ncbi:MAG: CHASE4 domain-containing protein [Armatimonadota bacterium]
MSFRTKAVITAFSTTLLVLALVFWALSQVVSYSFNQLEMKQAKRSVSLIMGAITEAQNSLRSSVSDWGLWDETYDFALTQPQKYIDENLDGNSLRNLQVSTIIITNINKEVLSATSVDVKNGRCYEAPFATTQRCLTLLDFFKSETPEETVAGLVMQREGPQLVVAGRVMHTDRSGPQAGYVIMARELDGQELTRIGHGMNVEINLYTIPSERATQEIAGKTGMNINQPWIKTISETENIGYAIMPSYPKGTQMLLSVKMPRELLIHANISLRWMATITICIGLILLFIQIKVINRIVISRLDDMGHRIVDIAHKQDTNDRLPVEGHDEITRVAQAVNWMLDTLQQSNQDLRDVNTEQQDLIRIISHDLKTPLRSIGSLAGMLSQDLENHLDDDSRWMLDTMVARMQKAYSLIDAVVDYQQAGTPPSFLDEINLTQMLNDLLQIMPPPEGVEVEIPPQMPSIKANRSRMVNVFRNLLSDSYESVPAPGGILTFSSVDQGDHFVITLHNNAEALAPQYHRMVFEVMRRFESDTSDEEIPNMLLPTVRRIIEAHGGHVWLDSAEGEGRSFHFTIPK